MFRTAVFISALALFVSSARFEDVPEDVRKLSGEELVNYINKEGGTWQATSYAKFEGKSKEELKEFLGAIKKPAHMRRRGRPAKPVKLDAVPDSFDAMAEWPQCVGIIGLIQDQSACGSCWAVSTTSAMSDRLCIASNGKIQTSLSALDLMACCNYCGYQCQGGYPDEAFYQWTYKGIVTGSNYTVDGLCKPYPIQNCHLDKNTGKNVCPKEPKSKFKCDTSCQPTYKTETYVNDHYFGSDVQSFDRENDAVIAELIKNGPVVAAFNVYEDFYKYKSGIYEYKAGDFVGGHAVRIVGFGSEGGVDYWKVANSWNTYFGEDGYFRIRRGTNECGFEEEITSALADVARSLKNKKNQ